MSDPSSPVIHGMWIRGIIITGHITDRLTYFGVFNERKHHRTKEKYNHDKHEMDDVSNCIHQKVEYTVSFHEVHHNDVLYMMRRERVK